MGHTYGLSIEEQRKADKKVGTKGFWILLAVTLIEVTLALYMKPFLPGFLIKLLMIVFSLGKAYWIVSKFMHLGHEVGGMALTIVMPTTILIWAIIAFLWEGNYARDSRNYVKDARPGAEVKATEKPEQTGMKSADELSKQVSFL